jgi:hypothetical protein
MSGVNTKSSKVDRALRRICDMADQSASIERLSNSLKLATETAHRLDAENARLRKYLGSVLFERRRWEMNRPIPTLTGAATRDAAPNFVISPNGDCTCSICTKLREQSTR